MKQEFSTSWISSSQVRKQRKFRYNAPLHIRHSFLSANLSKLLREKYGKRSIPLRKGDEVLIMRGSSKKKKGKVSIINLKNSKVAIEGIQRTRKNGSKVNILFHPSVLQIQTLNLDDKQRVSALERKASTKTVKTTKVEKATSEKTKTKKTGEKQNA